jgi:quercetin dioxygenase-like cupin family protein
MHVWLRYSDAGSHVLGMEPSVLLVGMTPADRKKFFEERQGVDVEAQKGHFRACSLEIVGPSLGKGGKRETKSYDARIDASYGGDAGHRWRQNSHCSASAGQADGAPQNRSRGNGGKGSILYIAELAPGAVAGKHFHPGPEMGYILEGTLTLEPEGKPPVTYKAGEAFDNPAKQVHDAKNASSSAPAKVLVFLIGEKGQPLATAVK